MVTPFLRSCFLFLSLTLLASRAFSGVTPLGVADWPLHFEANQGQAHDEVKFVARGPGYGVYLTAQEAVLALSTHTSDGCATDDATAQSTRAVRMRLLGGAKAPAVHAVDEQRGKANYFVGNDPSQWRTNIPTYAKVRYDEVYPGIDVVYYGNQRQLEYDFVLAPGADPRRIEIKFDGADRVEIDANGDLVLHACGHEIRQPKPVVYQEADGRHEVAGRYVEKGRNRIGFKVAAYDRSRPLIIDPLVLSYATYLGASFSDDEANDVAVDTRGNAYVTGMTFGLDFPVTPGAYQTSAATSNRAFVAKFDSAGALVYSTLLGAGTRNQGIAVDQDGNAYVAGMVTGSFPTTPGAFQEQSSFANTSRSRTFVTKLNPTGSALVYSTLLAGHTADPNLSPLEARRVDIAVDSLGSAHVTGMARETDFPTTPGAFQEPGGQIFVAKLDPTGSALVYSSRFANAGAQINNSVNSWTNAIALDRNGNAYVTGVTVVATFPVTAGAFQTTFQGYDAFVTKLSAAGALVYSTFLGGSSADEGHGIAVDPAGNAYIAGSTKGNFPTTPRAYEPTRGGAGFVAKLNASGSGLVYSTFLRASASDIVVDAGGRAYVAAGEDAFVSTVAPSGSWVDTSGVHSGSGIYEATSGIGRNAAANANLWVVGYTSSLDFPVTPNAYRTQRTSGAGRGTDAFVAKFSASTAPIPGTIEAEDFDQGGEGVGYHDNTPGNQGDAGFRTNEDVDLFVANDASGGSAYIVKNFEAGEWLAYTISVPANGNYAIELRASTNSAFPNPAYHIEIDGTNATGTVVLPDTGGWDGYQWLGRKTVALSAGTHVLKLVSETAYFNVNSISVSTATVSTPYFNAPAALPGQIEAETFDAGGEGIGYHENTPGNQGDAGFRTGEDADVFGSNDTGSGSWYIVKNFDTGEWLAYTISVPTTGDYDIELRASTSSAFPNSAYHVDIDGTNVTGLVVLPDTGGWNQYQWIGKRTVTLPAGVHVLKLVSERQYFMVNTIKVTPTTAPVSRAFYGTPIAVPGVFEAEAFDKGGDGAAHHDNAWGNQGNAGFRDGDDVDIFVTNDAASGSPYVVKNFEAGEWLSYTINVPAGGNYDVELRTATHSAFPNSAYHIEVDGADATGTVVLPNTGGWDNYQWLGKRTIALTGGVHVLTVVADQQYFNFNSVRLRSSP